MAAVALSVVVPTGRRRLLIPTLHALRDQDGAPPFEVVVVLDGADEEAAALVEGLAAPFEARLLVQSRRGLDHARDLGASAARGDALLFIGDDHLADDRLLAAVWASHEDGADTVQPRLLVHQGTTNTVVTAFASRWAQTRSGRVGTGPLLPADLCISPLSLRLDAYAALRQRTGPPGFARPGDAEDFRVGMALRELGITPIYLPEEACRSRVGETIEELLARSEEIGRVDAALSAESPDVAEFVRAARAARWFTMPRQQREVEASPERARAQSAKLGQELMAEARRGVSAPESLDRLERAVALHYWLGFRGDGDGPGRGEDRRVLR